MPLVAFAAALTVLVMGQPSEAGARDELRLRWEAPAECPTGAEVEGSVARRLARRPVTERRLDAQVTVKVDAGEYAVRLETLEEGEQSVREWRSSDCAEASETAALILAMSIDPLAEPDPAAGEDLEPIVALPTEDVAPLAGLPEPVGTQSGPALPPAPPVSAELVHDAVPEPASPEERVGVRGHVLGGVGFGPLPGVGGIVRGGVGVGAARWRAEATGEYWTPSQGGNSSNPDAEVRAQLYAVGGRGCYVVRATSVTIPICGGLIVGQMIAEGQNVARTDRARSAWVAARAGVGVMWWPARWIGLGGRVDAHVALYRPRFTTEPSGEVHVARAAGLSGVLGVSFRHQRRL